MEQKDQAKINAIRKTILEMVYRAKVSHIGSAFSIIEILYVLYFKHMNIDPKKPKDLNRDKFVLSKAHGSAGLYGTLAHRGFFPHEILEGYCLNNGTLPAHLDMETVAGIEASAGSLGHGFPIALGLALANKKQKNPGKVFAIVSDGECNEGSIWEAAMLAPALKLDNLTVIIDYNKIQSFGRTNEIIDQSNLAERWQSFGWTSIEINGHDLNEIEAALNADFKKRPKAIIAHTIKGKGVSFMEDKLMWHYKSPDDKELQIALEELNA